MQPGLSIPLFRGHEDVQGRKSTAMEMTLLWKSQNDFHSSLENLAREREIPTFPQPIIFVSDEKRRQKNETHESTTPHTQNF
jgi:hypothetical protein